MLSLNSNKNHKKLEEKKNDEKQLEKYSVSINF